MNRENLIKKIVKDTDISVIMVSTIFDSIFVNITEELLNDGDVSIPKFGKFSLTHRDARDGINPATKEVIEIEPRRYLRFKAKAFLRDALNK